GTHATDPHRPSVHNPSLHAKHSSTKRVHGVTDARRRGGGAVSIAMTTIFRIGLAAAIAVLLSAALRAVEPTWIYAVQVTASVSADPARIDLTWPADHLPAERYTVHRKSPDDIAWSEGIALSGDATQFSDENVEAGRVYEYQ